MKQRYLNLVIILLLVAVALYIDLPNNAIKIAGRTMEPVLGLDLQGGLQVILGTKTDIPLEKLEDAKTILEQRTNALGVAENRRSRVIVTSWPSSQARMSGVPSPTSGKPACWVRRPVTTTRASRRDNDRHRFLPPEDQSHRLPGHPNGSFHRDDGRNATSANVGRLS